MSAPLEQSPAPKFVLTGGMGSGKSTAGKVFSELGAAVIDADDVVRDLRKPGEPGYQMYLDVLGNDIVAPDETLDKQRIATKIFRDSVLRKRIEARLHPLVWGNMFHAASHLDANSVAVFEVPLLRKRPDAIDGVVAVITDLEKAIERLIAHRGYTEEEATVRIATQPSNEERISLADHVIENNATLEEYKLAIAGAWGWMNSTAEQHRSML